MSVSIKNVILGEGRTKVCVSIIGKNVDDAPFSVLEYIRDLPTVTVNGNTYRFMNGVGFGVDGYCCEEGDRMKAEHPDVPVNYTAIAIKGVLGKYKPANALVTVDGVEKKYKKVWIAAAMHGRYYGGGMMCAPEQDRLAEDKQNTLVVWHGSGKLSTLMNFPKIFEGKHVEKKKMIDVVRGKEITVKFDRPCALQIDGETVLDVTSYTVKAASLAKKEAEV
jgi:diacylglycerol kinase family enzyme